MLYDGKSQVAHLDTVDTVSTKNSQSVPQPSPLAPSAQSLGALLLEEWDRLVMLHGRPVANNWMRKLDNEHFAALIEALRFGRRAQ
jgi:hypothetical protein